MSDGKNPSCLYSATRIQIRQIHSQDYLTVRLLWRIVLLILKHTVILRSGRGNQTPEASAITPLGPGRKTRFPSSSRSGTCGRNWSLEKIHRPSSVPYLWCHLSENSWKCIWWQLRPLICRKYTSAPSIKGFLTLTLWSCALLDGPQFVQPLGSSPAFYGTRRFITAFTRALHLYLSWARPIQCTPHHTVYIMSILMLSIHLRLGLPSGLFPSSFLPISYMRSCSLPFVLHVPPTSSSSTL
jgi:hypothetical protein